MEDKHCVRYGSQAQEKYSLQYSPQLTFVQFSLCLKKKEDLKNEKTKFVDTCVV